MKKYVGDFETSTWCDEETWVWAWALCDIETEEVVIGTELDEFINFCKKNKNSQVFFHNLKFDGEFIIYWLLTNGYIHITEKEDIKENTFTTLISDLGQFYNIVVYFDKGNKHYEKVTFIDSLKVIPLPVSEIPKAFNIKEEKLEIDYNKPRYRGWRLTEIEKKYISHDVLIVAKALKMMFAENLNKMTIGSNALNNYKQIITKRKFEHYYPNLDIVLDSDLRKCYKGRVYLP